jgi:hypothetical protein
MSVLLIAAQLISSPYRPEISLGTIVFIAVLALMIIIQWAGTSILIWVGIRNKKMLRSIHQHYLANHERMKALLPQWIKEYHENRELGIKLEREYNELHKRDEKRTEAICYEVQLTRHF